MIMTCIVAIAALAVAVIASALILPKARMHPELVSEQLTMRQTLMS